MFVFVVVVHCPYCVFCCLQNRNVPQRMHLQDSVDEMKKFNARRKLKVMYTIVQCFSLCGRHTCSCFMVCVLNNLGFSHFLAFLARHYFQIVSVFKMT